MLASVTEFSFRLIDPKRPNNIPVDPNLKVTSTTTVHYYQRASGDLLLCIVHHQIRWPDGIIVIHHEFVVIQPSADFGNDLFLHQHPAGELTVNDAHRIVTSTGRRNDAVHLLSPSMFGKTKRQVSSKEADV